MDLPRSALIRAEWQAVLFETPNRADLLGCIPAWSLRHVRVRVHRNHGFEAVSSATPAFASWNGVAFEWLIGGYDDTLSFDLSAPADVDVVWLDTDRIVASEGLDAWLVGRLRALRSQTTNPIVVLAWPLADAQRAAIVAAALPGTFVADVSPLADALGAHWLDPRTEAISGTRLGNRACLRIARELACCWLPAVTGAPRKVIAIDLDDTLYRGILAEDGPLGVELTSGHRELQARLARFRADGILLALVSHNELEDVEALFARCRDFSLRLADFSAVEVSWRDKVESLRRIADQLRVDADAIVFVDDNAGELAAVASALPVFTVHARREGAETVAALEHTGGLFRWQRSAEDALRAGDLRASLARASVAQSAASPDDYLRSLEVRLEFLVGPRQYLARLAELSAKTHQFNLSLRRMNAAEIAQRLERRASNVIAICLADRLSDSGIIGMLVGSRVGDTLHVDELCVSCRALGRRLEDSMLTKALIVMAGESATGNVVFAVRKGPRNAPARAWLAQYSRTRLADAAETLDLPFDVVSHTPISPAIRTRVVP
jgi:FkbH-like protein